MSKHTPGPWVFEHDDFMVYSKNDSPIAAVNEDFEGENPEASEEGSAGEYEANARLIAAAPELLEALKAVVQNHCANSNLYCGTCTPARTAIAKAEGAQ